MSDRVFLGKIHKVIAGPNPKDGMAHVVGKCVDAMHPNIFVSSIQLSEDWFEKTGQLYCVVWVIDKDKNDNNETPYKTFIGTPLTLHSDI